LIEETASMLHGYTEHTEQATTLTAPISVTTGGITVQVSDASVLSRGYVEIDQELVFAESVNKSVNTFVVPAWGRAQQGSTAVTHSANAKATMSPRYPRARVKRALNECIAAVYPKLFAVKVDETQTADPSRYTYPLPADARGVLDISWQDSAVTTSWWPVSAWRIDPKAHTATYPSGLSVSILDGMEPGRPIKIVYEAAPASLVNESDDYATVTGLPESSSDVVCLAAASRLCIGTEVARQQPMSVEQSERTAIMPAGGTLNASKYLYGLYQQRLEEERDRLMDLYPVTRGRGW
jgi:hypothetical protein